MLEQAKADIFPTEVAIASNVVKFDRPGASLANRDSPKRVALEGLLLSID